jgi:hypothetical protein
VRRVEKVKEVYDVLFQHESLGAPHVLVGDGWIEYAEKGERKGVSFSVKEMNEKKKMKKNGKKKEKKKKI